MLVVFVFMKLQPVRVVMGTLVWFVSRFALDTKKSFEDFCDFVLIFGFKFLDKLNLSEGMDPRIMKKNPQRTMFLS
jgi:hypothetical protein